MKLGFQGIENCYSYQVCKNYFSEDDNNFIGFESFDKVFRGLSFGLIDYAIIPIENSIGGCIFMNFDNFYKYNIKIHCEFHHDVNHSLYCKKDSNLLSMKKVISHPQAIQQCKENIKNLDLEMEEYWDTTGSLERLAELDNSYCAIGPPDLGNKYNLMEIEKNFNDQENNITRFYLISLNKISNEIKLKNGVKVSNLKSYDSIPSDTIIPYWKFSGYAVFKDELGCLCNYLESFRKNNINLTKIESRPYLGKDRNVFSYIFYIEGIYGSNYTSGQLIDPLEDLNYSESFNYFGSFPLIQKINQCIASDSTLLVSGEIKETPKNLQNNLNPLKIGIVGFGRFGKFISERMVKYGFNVYTTSRKDYTKTANKLNIEYLKFDEFININLDVIIFSTSINSFEKVLDSFPIEFLKDKLIVDVLSVKEFPLEVIKNKVGNNCPILVTHPMFGPDSGKDSWKGKKFVYWVENINELTNVVTPFLKFWEDQGCKLLKLKPEVHDELSANSQFISHFIGRLLEEIGSEETIIDTDLYKHLIKVMEYSVNDSWDLFEGLYNFNKKSKNTLSRFKYCFDKLVNKLENNTMRSNQMIKGSDTASMFSKIVELKEKGKKIHNQAIGIPTWYPKGSINLEYNKFEYSTSKGDSEFINKIIKMYHDKNLLKNGVSLRNENILITPGGKPALYIILKLLTRPGSSWLLPKPYWVTYPDIIKSLSGNVNYLESDLENEWCPKIEDVESKLITGENDSINGIILCNPNNPTGVNYPITFINKLLNLCETNGLYLVVDEVYLLLRNDLKTLFQNNKNIIIFSSFSKYHSLPGVRIGYIMADPEIVNNLVKLQSIIFTANSTTGKLICEEILKKDYKPNLSNLLISKNIISRIFISKGWMLDTQSKNDKDIQMYLFPYHDNEDYVLDTIENLLVNGLAVISGSSFGNKNCIRITLTNNLKDLDEIALILNNNL